MHERENGNEKENATENRILTHPRVLHTSPFFLSSLHYYAATNLQFNISYKLVIVFILKLGTPQSRLAWIFLAQG